MYKESQLIRTLKLFYSNNKNDSYFGEKKNQDLDNENNRE